MKLQCDKEIHHESKHDSNSASRNFQFTFKKKGRGLQALDNVVVIIWIPTYIKLTA
jgi:hypothetical protein